MDMHGLVRKGVEGGAENRDIIRETEREREYGEAKLKSDLSILD